MPDVDLGPHFEAYVRAAIADGRFRDVGEAVRAGLRLLERDHAASERRLEEIRAELAARMNDGLPRIPADEVFAELFGLAARARSGGDGGP